MTADDPRLAMIQENSRFARQQLGYARGEPMGLDAVSVEWAEGFIERHRSKYANAEARGGLVSVIGSYLGEAVIAATDGTWAEDAEGHVGIRFSCGDWCYPFGKVDKQFAQGLEGGESILSFYNVAVGLIATGGLREAAAAPGGVP